MPKLDVVGVGLSTMDILIRLAEMPTWDKRSTMDQVNFDGGGPTATALCAAASLGAKAGFIGTAGEDWFAEQKRQSLREHGVDISRVVPRSGPEKRVVCVYVNANTGDRIFNRMDHFYEDLVQPKELDQFYITQADYLLTEGFHSEAAVTAARWMRAAGKRVVLDAAATTSTQIDERLTDLVPLTDILICGSGFAKALTGEEDPAVAGKAALSFGPDIVVITHGEMGSLLFSNDESLHTPAFDIDVLDTTGAGDVFHGAFIVGLLKNWDLQKVCIFASAAAAIACTFLGGRAGLSKYSQVEQFLHGRGYTL